MFLSLVHFDSLSVEATARRVPNGDLVVICTCGGLREPAIENLAYLFRSTDNGCTWSKKQLLCELDGYAHYHTCTAVLNGELWIFISRHSGRFSDWTNYVLISEDSGFTFRRRELPLLPEYAFVRSMTVTKSGRILFPYHYYPVTKAQSDDCKAKGVIICASDIPFIENGLIVSDDGGKTFKRQVAFLQQKEEIPVLGSGHRWSWTENSVAELENGHLVMMFRVDSTGYLWRTDSFDNGDSWQKPVMTDIPNPSNKPHLLNGRNGEIILINTPCNTEGIFYLRKRFPLEVWVSYDNMASWAKKIRISDFPGAYSYADGFVEDDGHLRLAFEFNRHDIYYADVDLSKD